MRRALVIGLMFAACLAPARAGVRPRLASGVERLRAIHEIHPPGPLRRFAEVVHAAPAADLRVEGPPVSLLRKGREPVPAVVREVEEVAVVRREERSVPVLLSPGHAPRETDCQPDTWLAYHRALNEWHRSGGGMDERYRRHRAAEKLWIAEANVKYGRPPPTAPDLPAPLPRRRRRVADLFRRR